MTTVAFPLSVGRTRILLSCLSRFMACLLSLLMLLFLGGFELLSNLHSLALISSLMVEGSFVMFSCS